MATPINPEKSTDPSIDEIEDDIRRTRERLGETVDELSDRLDVKRRAKAKLSSASPSPAVGVGAALAVATVVVVIYFWRRR